MHKVGIIGFGKMGQIREKVISSMNDIEVKLIYDYLYSRFIKCLY